MRSSVGNIRVIDLFINMIKGVVEMSLICIMVSIAYTLT